MKNRWESKEVFTKYAEMEAIDWMLKQELIGLSKPLSVIEQMIDASTGFGQQQTQESITRTKDLLTQKLACQKFLEIDGTDTEAILAKVDELGEHGEI